MSKPTVASQAEQPAALPLRLNAGLEDGEDEWEYEYSTTETETYYLTIELSYPEFKGLTTKNPHHSRGGYYKHWLGMDDNEAPAQPPATATKQAVDARMINPNEEDDDEPIPAAEVEEDNENLDIDPSLMATTQNIEDSNQERDQNSDHQRKKNGELNDGQDEEALDPDNEPYQNIQILDLHSHHPIISYKGRVFEGQWAEVIGTEAILSHHDKENQLPALRHLPGNVDLLAASSARIMTKEKVMKPNQPEEDSLAAVRKEWYIRIPYGKDKHGERAKQAHFLERLIALKLKKGETDQVTVYAKVGDGKNFRDDRDPDFRPRRKKPMEDADAEYDEHGKRKRKRSGRPAGRPRTKHQGVLKASLRDGGPAMPSTPTPQQWKDLDSFYEEEEDESEEEGEEMEGINEDGDADGSEDSQESDEVGDGDDDEVDDYEEESGYEDEGVILAGE